MDDNTLLKLSLITMLAGLVMLWAIAAMQGA
jgi:hypothetical protein